MKLRRLENWTPVLTLTAKSGALDENTALDTGADDYMTKPFSSPVLVARADIHGRERDLLAGLTAEQRDLLLEATSTITAVLTE